MRRYSAYDNNVHIRLTTFSNLARAFVVMQDTSSNVLPGGQFDWLVLGLTSKGHQLSVHECDTWAMYHTKIMLVL